MDQLTVCDKYVGQVWDPSALFCWTQLNLKGHVWMSSEYTFIYSIVTWLLEHGASYLFTLSSTMSNSL